MVELTANVCVTRLVARQTPILQSIMQHAWTNVARDGSYVPIGVSSFKFHLLSFRRSIQDYKIHMDMETVIFLELRGETNLEVYSNHMVQYIICGVFPIQII